MFNDFNYSFKYFCVIYLRFLLNLFFKIKFMFMFMCNVYYLYKKVYYIFI